MSSLLVWLVVVAGVVVLLGGLHWAIADFWLDRVGAPLLDWRHEVHESE